MEKNYFNYYDGSDVIPQNAFRISPSQLSKFFDATHQWWAEQVYKEAPAFVGSTSSELGTCVHAAAAMYFDTKTINKAAIEQYILMNQNPEVDKQIILNQYKPMIEALVNGFLAQNIGTVSEEFIYTEIAPNIYAAGSVDMYDKNKATIYDYKTMGSLDTARVPTTFPRSYWFQQMLYAWIHRKNGNPVNWLKLVYISRNETGRISEKTGKPLKDYPSEVNILTHQITESDMEIIESCIKLVAESVQLWKDHPEYRHIICQDMRRKEKAKAKLFKD